MNYLANYYKNLCEQLQQEIILVEQQIHEQATGMAGAMSATSKNSKLAQQPATNRMKATGSGTITKPPVDTPAPAEATAAEQDEAEAEAQTREDAEDTMEEPQGATQEEPEEPTRGDAEDTGKMPQIRKDAEANKTAPVPTPSETGLKAGRSDTTSSGGAGFGGSKSSGVQASEGSGRASWSGAPPSKSRPKQNKGEEYEEYKRRVEDWEDQVDEYKEYLKQLRRENMNRPRERGQRRAERQRKEREEQQAKDKQRADEYKRKNEERRARLAPGTPGTTQYGPPSPS